MTSTPIADYALLSDANSSALVSTEGSIDWLCFGRFDAPPVCCRLLDDEAGHWSIAARGTVEASRRYLDGTLVMATTFRTPTGTVTLEDALALEGPDPGHAIGARAPGVLVRRIRCDQGEVAVDMTYAPRPEFGLIMPLLQEVEQGLRARGGAGVLRLSTPDAGRYLRSYAGDGEFLRHPSFPQAVETWLDRVNIMMREGGQHLWVYDSESLLLLLRRAGFTSCVEQQFGISQHPRMQSIDLESRAFESLYVEAVK